LDLTTLPLNVAEVTPESFDSCNCSRAYWESSAKLSNPDACDCEIRFDCTPLEPVEKDV